MVDVTTGQSLLYIFILTFSTFLFGLSLYFAINISGKNNTDGEGKFISINDLKYLKFLLWFISYFILYFMVTVIYELSFTYLAVVGINNIFNWIYIIMTSCIIPVILAVIFVIVTRKIQDEKFQNMLKRGIDQR